MAISIRFSQSRPRSFRWNHSWKYSLRLSISIKFTKYGRDHWSSKTSQHSWFHLVITAGKRNIHFLYVIWNSSFYVLTFFYRDIIRMWESMEHKYRAEKSSVLLLLVVYFDKLNCCSLTKLHQLWIHLMNRSEYFRCF